MKMKNERGEKVLSTNAYNYFIAELKKAFVPEKEKKPFTEEEENKICLEALETFPDYVIEIIDDWTEKQIIKEDPKSVFAKWLFHGGEKRRLALEVNRLKYYKTWPAKDLRDTIKQ